MRGFSDEERTEIRETIVEIGRDVLTTLGPTKTTVKDITDQVGIAKSTFYVFFDTKADLYEEIFRRERNEFLDQVRRELDDVTDAETGLERLFQTYLSWVAHSPLLQTLFIGNDDTFSRDIPDQTIRHSHLEALRQMYNIIEEWQTAGEMEDVRSEIFFGMTGSVALVASHRDAFDAFEDLSHSEICDVLIESLVTRLTTKTSAQSEAS